MSVTANISLSFAVILTLLGCSGKTALSTGGSPPPSQSLTATLQVSPTSQSSSGTVVLSWATTGAASVSIDQAIGTVPANGSTNIAIASTTTWTLTARDGTGNTVTSSATAAVLPAHGATLQVTPTTIGAPGNVTLSWSTTGAASVNLDHGIGAVAASGTMTEMATATTTWTLTATDNGGGVTTATATVTLAPPGTGWQKIPLPAALTSAAEGVRGIMAAPDGFLYAGGRFGVYRISQAGAVSGAQWQNISTGLPTQPSGGLEPVGVFGLTSKGTVLVGLGANPVSGDVLRVARFDSSSQSWTVAGGPAVFGSSRINYFSNDSAGNVYVVDSWSGNISRSSDDGMTFTTIVQNAYVHAGQTAGAVWVGTVIHNQFWWGGEGGLNISDLTFTSNTPALQGAACDGVSSYCGNLFDIASDGSPSIAPSEVLVVRTDPNFAASIQRLDVATNTWTPVSGNIAQYWGIHTLVNGSAAHEYFAAGSHPGNGGVIHSTDGGRTWTLYNTGLGTTAQAGADLIRVSSVDGSKYLRVLLGQEIWYHP